MSGEPFHRCTHTALSPQGDIYVSDGYGNARVHKYSPDGKLLLSWGEPGTDPGQFNIAHNICCDPDGWVYVADRENHRVQVFDGNGKYETQWNNMHRPCGLYASRTRSRSASSASWGRAWRSTATCPISGRAWHRHPKGKLLARLGGRRGRARAGPVHRAARPGGRFARRHLCRRGLLHRVSAAFPEQYDTVAHAITPEAGESRVAVVRGIDGLTGFPLARE